MSNGIVVADSGPIFSLAMMEHLDILTSLFQKILIPNAVWQEITANQHCRITTGSITSSDKVQPIQGFNELLFIMDYGESESLTLYKESNADFLLLDDKKAHGIAENFGMNCIGTLGVMSSAKDKNLIGELKPLFETFIRNKRYYSKELLNYILIQKGEDPIE